MRSSSDAEEKTVSGTLPNRLQAAVNLFPLTRFPADLATLTLFVGTSVFGIGQLPPGSLPRFALAVPLLLLCPGYAVVAALYPTEGSLPVTSMSRTGTRLALSFGLSLVVVSVTVIAVGTVAQFGFVQVLVALGAVTLVVTQFAVVRRMTAPQERRYQVPVRGPLVRSIDALGTRSSFAQFSAVLLAVALIVSSGAVFAAIANPPAENDFTEFYVGTEDENGTVATAEYPETLGDGPPLVFGVTNHESTVEEYVVVVQLQEVDTDGTVTSRQELDRFQNTVAVGETWHQDHSLQSTETGDERRLQYLLYREEPPETPTEANAYRTVHVWVNDE